MGTGNCLITNIFQNILFCVKQNNVGKQTVDGSHWLPLNEKNTMEVNGYRQMFAYQHSSEFV